MKALDVDRHTADSSAGSMHRRRAYDAALDRYFVLAYRKATLEIERDRESLADDPEYRDLLAFLARIETRLDELYAGLSPTEAAAMAGYTGPSRIVGIDHVAASLARPTPEK